MVKPANLTSDDEKVLEHIHRFRITTPQVLGKLFYPTETLEDVRYRYRELRRAGCVGVGQLYGHQPYYFLTHQAALDYFNDREAGPLDEHRLIDAYAVLAFCCLSDPPRQRLTPREFSNDFPDLLKPYPPSHGYYVDTGDTKTRLGLVKVDRAFNYQRSGLHLARIIQDRIKHPGWKRVIEHDDFAVTFVTAWAEKAKRIAEVLASHPQPAPCRVHVVEDLRHMVSRRAKEV